MSTLIVTHDHADFDALASAVAASKLYADSWMALAAPCNHNVRAFLNLYRDFLPLVDIKDDEARYDRMVVVDANRRKRIEKYAALLDRGVELHLYDHHTEQESDLEASYEFLESVGATATLMVEEIRKRGSHLEDWEATLLAMGIYEDTGNLMFNTTTPRDVEALSFLWQKGVKIEMLQEFLQVSLTVSQRNLLEKLISQTEFYEVKQRRIMLSWASLEGYVYGIGELVQHLSELGEAEAVFCLVEMEGKVLLIARSYSEDINLLELLSWWQAKGHSSAATVTLKEKTLEEVKRELWEIIQNHLEVPARAREIASSPVNTVQPATTVEEALDMLYRLGHSGFPVLEDGRLVGVISRKDLEKARRSSLTHAPVKGFMSKKVISAHPEDSVNHVQRLMMSHNIGRVPLVNQKGELEGLVTRSDLLYFLYNIESKKKTYRGISKTNDSGVEDIKNSGSLPDSLEDLEDLTGLINRNLSFRVQRLLLLIGQAAEKEDLKVFLVGGSIRDLLLGEVFPKDLDFVVLFEAIPFAEKLSHLLGGKLQVFEPFGTASIFLPDGMRLDLVTARKEFYAAPGKLPQVETSSLKNDLFRRDFTINTLACSLNPDSFGQLQDFFGGIKDLQKGILRVLYHLSFVDDPLRILRAVRFEQRFGFKMEKETAQYLKKAVRRRLLEKVTRDRLNGELRLVFGEDDPVAALKRMHGLGIFSFAFPRLRPDYKTWWMLYRVKEVLDWAHSQEWESRPDEELVYLGALYYGAPRQTLFSVGRRMHYSRSRVQMLVACAEGVPEVLEKFKEEKLRPSTVYNTLDPLPTEALLLLMAVSEEERVREYPRWYWNNLQKTGPHLRGHHLKQMGIQQGPLMGRVLQDLKEAVLDGRVTTLEEEKKLVLSYLEEKKGEQ